MKWINPRYRIERKLMKQTKYDTYMLLNGFKSSRAEWIELLLQYIV